jgi:hypothetical protein
MASPVLEVTNRVENGRFGFTTVGGGNICGVTTSPPRMSICVLAAE